MKIEHDEELDSVFDGEEAAPSPSSVPTFISVLPVDTQTLRPMTAKMLLDGFSASRDAWNISVDEQLVSTVRMIGRMVCIGLNEHLLTFKLNDGTGTVDVFHWFTHDSDRYECQNIREGDYVVMNGKPASKEEGLEIRSLNVRAITNYDDITHHFLECIFTHLDTLKRNARKARERVLASTSTSSVRLSQQISPSPVPREGRTEERILGILRDPAYRDIEHGVSFKLLIDLIGVEPKEITRATDTMLRVGAIFTTISEHHFKSSDY